MSYLKNKYNESKISLYFFISLIPLICFGIYKNGFKPYFVGVVDIFSIFNLLLIVLIPLFIIMLFCFIKKRKLRLNDFYMYTAVLFMPCSLNFLFFSVCFFIFFMLSNLNFKKNVPFNVLLILFIYFVTFVFGDLSMANSIEATNSFKYSYLDKFIGFNVSYLFSSSFLFNVISFIYLCSKPYFKKIIPIISFLLYLNIAVILNLTINYDLSNLSGIFLCFIYLGSVFTFTPISKRNIIIYSIVLAVLTILSSLIFGNFVGCFISVFIIFILSNFPALKTFTN